jgi:hypothetical protein
MEGTVGFAVRSENLGAAREVGGVLVEESASGV